VARPDAVGKSQRKYYRADDDGQQGEPRLHGLPFRRL